MRPLAAAAALLLTAGLAAPLRAGDRMTSADHDMARSVAGGGGASVGSFSTNHRLDAGTGEDAAASTATASLNHRINPGYFSLFAFPAALTNLTGLDGVSVSSVSLQWTTPGVDGTSGTLATGSRYFLRVASYTLTADSSDAFRYFSDANVVISTSAMPPGSTVAPGVTSLIANTTYFAALWTISENGDLSYPRRSTFTTLAHPVSLLSESFLNVMPSSAAAQWAARPTVLQDVSSMTSEGYRVEASSTNFGALTPGGAVYSSMTPNVALSTLTIGPVAPPDHLCVDHYFRTASLNWEGRRNYTLLGSTRSTEYGVLVSTQDLEVGGVDLGVEVVISTSLLITNSECPVTYQLKVEALTPGTPWVVAASPGDDAFTVSARFSTLIPDAGDFVAADKLTTTAVSATPAKFAGDQNGAAVPVTAERLAWFKLAMPTSTSTADAQQIRVSVYAVAP